MANPLTLVREFPAMEPQLEFPPMAFSEFLKAWSEPIDVLHRAIIGLTEDIAMFQAMGLHIRRTAAGEEFLRSVLYYSKILVLGSLEKIEAGLQVYNLTPSWRRTETIQSLGSNLTEARKAFDRFSGTTTAVLDTAGWKIEWKAPKTGDKVPSASPYQLLYELICVKKMSSAPTDHIERVLSSLVKQRYLSLPELPPGIERVKDYLARGRPTMLFVAATPDRSRIVFGANNTAWGKFTAIAAITRRARDVRLQQYIPRATPAFRALKRKEQEALSELRRSPGASSLAEKELQYRARSKAIERMRSDSSFLGGQNEIGIALRPPTWAFNQGCYACQGMMGYRSPNSPPSEKQRKSYILQFNWQLRGGNAHSCAEGEARLQSLGLE